MHTAASVVQAVCTAEEQEDADDGDDDEDEDDEDDEDEEGGRKKSGKAPAVPLPSHPELLALVGRAMTGVVVHSRADMMCVEIHALWPTVICKLLRLLICCHHVIDS